MLRFYRVVFILSMMVFACAQAFAQRPSVASFPETPCDSTFCDSSLVFTNASSSFPEIVLGATFRDGTSYATSATFPDTIQPGGRYVLPVCFTPERRGVIGDSISVRILTQNGLDTVRIRLNGRGIGPDIIANPPVLNFPKTNPTFTSTLRITFRNAGERPYTLTPALLTIPAPFTVTTPLPVTIGPGDSIEIEFTFEPDENGVYSETYVLPTGCNFKLQLGFNGATDLIGTGAVLRMSKTGFNPINNEQTPCDGSRCTDVTISNVGNAPLVVESFDWTFGDRGYMLVSPPPTPLLLGPNTQRVLQVCLNGKTRGRINDTLIVTSNTRSSIAFGMLIDVSGSMLDSMTCGTNRKRRIDEARVQAHNFIGKTLLHLPAIGIQDQIAIHRYNSNTSPTPMFPLSRVTDLVRQKAQDTINTLRAFFNTGTRTGQGLRWLIDTLSKSQLENRVVVLLSDGETEQIDQIRHPLSTLINLANSRNVRVFTIGLLMNDVGRSYLGQLASGTGGIAFDVQDCDSLQTAFESITDIVSRGTVTHEPFSIKVTAPVLVTIGAVPFDSTYHRDTTCRSITLTNVGEGDAKIDNADISDMVGAPSTEFYLDETLPIIVPEGEQKSITLCFNPGSLRMREGIVSFRYNNCDSTTMQAELMGAGFAHANLRIDDERAGLPGSTVTMPVYFDSTMTGFEVKTVRYRVRWNATMLDLRGVTPGAQAAGATVSYSPVAFNGREASMEVTMRGTDLNAPGELSLLEFQVLRGDTLATLVELTTGTFEDDNPKPLLKNAGLIAYDSTCFRSSKGILSAAPAAKITAGEVTPTPAFNDAASLEVESTAMVQARVSLFTADGALARATVEHTLLKGRNTLPIDLNDLTPGTYYLRLETTGGEAAFRKVMIAR